MARDIRAVGITKRTIKKAKESNEKAFKKIIKETDRISMRFAKTAGIVKMDHDDLIQESRIVAWKAVNKYKDDMGAKFTTFFTKLLLRKYDKHRKKERAQKRQIDFKADSLYRMIEEDAKLIDIIVDEQCEQRNEDAINRIFVDDMMDLLEPEGYMLCSFLLKGMSFATIAKRMNSTESKVRQMFKNHVKKQLDEAQKLGIL